MQGKGQTTNDRWGSGKLLEAFEEHSRAICFWSFSCFFCPPPNCYCCFWQRIG